MPGSPLLHHLPEFAQTHVHGVRCPLNRSGRLLNILLGMEQPPTMENYPAPYAKGAKGAKGRPPGSYQLPLFRMSLPTCRNTYLPYSLISSQSLFKPPLIRGLPRPSHLTLQPIPTPTPPAFPSPAGPLFSVFLPKH